MARSAFFTVSLLSKRYSRKLPSGSKCLKSFGELPEKPSPENSLIPVLDEPSK